MSLIFFTSFILISFFGDVFSDMKKELMTVGARNQLKKTIRFLLKVCWKLKLIDIGCSN